ncbi:MAG: GNAT family N-acetyltransferase [Gammaproteobacteria bacterium]|nr:GNAT family N-acetyltransferase [Gammaproteobacteria bacterium]
MGLAWGRFEDSDPHTAHLTHMWVAPEVRGLGLGRGLVECVIAWARANGARSIALSVTCGNAGAEQLYRSMAFAPVGEPVRLRPDSTLLEQNMVRQLVAPSTAPTNAGTVVLISTQLRMQ